eukprot:gb/GECH01008002.1/.p1 GENE.gb/GECH01008002.1/~~gb/GECH01008002.1/.p1  ORF type:complete len:470 (+),score=108.15 gb/GECH01008002.1/:1-1410(+)
MEQKDLSQYLEIKKKKKRKPPIKNQFCISNCNFLKPNNFQLNYDDYKLRFPDCFTQTTKRWIQTWNENHIPTSNPSRGPRSYITDLKFDKYFYLLVSVSCSGTITLTDYQQYLYYQNLNSKSSNSSFDICSIQTSRGCESVEWNPWNENQIFTSYASNPQIDLFDLSIKTEKPIRRMNLPSGRGALDICPIPQRRLIAAGSSDGMIRLFDVRAKSACVNRISMQRQGERINTIDTTGNGSDGNCICSGGADGTLELWDVRSMAQKLNTYRLPRNVNQLSKRLTSTSTSGDMVHDKTSLHKITKNPQRSWEMGFQLGRFCSGMLDLTTGELTKLYKYVPSERALHESSIRHIKPCFMEHGSSLMFCLPSFPCTLNTPSLSILDWSHNKTEIHLEHADMSLLVGHLISEHEEKEGHNSSSKIRSLNQHTNCPNMSMHNIPLNSSAACVNADGQKYGTVVIGKEFDSLTILN